MLFFDQCYFDSSELYQRLQSRVADFRDSERRANQKTAFSVSLRLRGEHSWSAWADPLRERAGLIPAGDQRITQHVQRLRQHPY